MSPDSHLKHLILFSGLCVHEVEAQVVCRRHPAQEDDSSTAQRGEQLQAHLQSRGQHRPRQAEEGRRQEVT